MTMAKARTAASVSSARTNWRQVSLKALMNCDGFNPTRTAAMIAANRQAVPDAASQLKLNTAPYPEAFATTGGIRWTRLCKPGHGTGIRSEEHTSELQSRGH